MNSVHTVSHLDHLSFDQQSVLREVDLAYASLKSSLNLLSHLLKAAQGPARVWALPLVRDEDSAGATLYVGDRKLRKTAGGLAEFGGSSPQLSFPGIEVTDVGARAADEARANGQTWVKDLHHRLAHDAAVALFSKLDKDRDQSPWVSDRAAGVICAPGAEIASAVAAVNTAKDRFKAAVQRLNGPARARHEDAPRQRRHRLIADHLPALRDTHLIQAYRHIPYIAHGVDAMSFGWARAMRQVRPQRVDAVIAELSERNKLDGEGKFEAELRQRGLEWLARVEPIAPFPIVNYQAPDSKTGKLKGRREAAILPIILAQSDLPSNIRGLPPFDPDPATWSKRHPRNSTKLNPEPLFVIAHTQIQYFSYREGIVPNVMKKDSGQ